MVVGVFFLLGVRLFGGSFVSPFLGLFVFGCGFFFLFVFVSSVLFSSFLFFLF